MNMFHRNRYNAETAVLLYLQTQKAVACAKGAMQPLRYIVNYYCLSKLTFIL